MRPDLIYVCNNNGSDTRITKEINSLAPHFSVHFLGFENGAHHPFERSAVSTYVTINGSARNIWSSLRFFAELWRLIRAYPGASVHVVNEPMLLLGYPLLIRRHVVLDLFDSIFLKRNAAGESAVLAKRLVYGPASRLIVTDNHRLNLLPRFARKKTSVIPNVPLWRRYPPKRADKRFLTLCYFGSLAENRGSRFILSLLQSDDRVRCIAAGWPVDEYTRALLRHERVEFLGSRPHSEINEVLARDGDYLVAIYPLNNLNNIYASPNKIFDAIHTRTPLIISEGVKVAAEVLAAGIGVAVNTEEDLDYCDLAQKLIEQRESFTFSAASAQKNSWEAYEERLISAHAEFHERNQQRSRR